MDMGKHELGLLVIPQKQSRQSSFWDIHSLFFCRFQVSARVRIPFLKHFQADDGRVEKGFSFIMGP